MRTKTVMRSHKNGARSCRRLLLVAGRARLLDPARQRAGAAQRRAHLARPRRRRREAREVAVLQLLHDPLGRLLLEPAREQVLLELAERERLALLTEPIFQ